MINLNRTPPMTLYLGRQGENGVRKLEFDFSDFKEKFGDGAISLVMRRSPSESPFPVALDVTEQSVCIWKVSRVETDVVGYGEAQFMYTVDGKVKKTVIYRTKVRASLEPISQTAPEAYQNWLDRLSEIGAQVSISKQLALEAIEDAEDETIRGIGDELNNVLQRINNAMLYAQQAIDSKKGIAVSEISNIADDIAQWSRLAVNASDKAKQFADDAEKYAKHAENYADNLHFLDTQSGTIEIKVGG